MPPPDRSKPAPVYATIGATLPGRRSPVQQALERLVEYATQADVRILAAEIRGLREAMETELRAQRETMDARIEKVEGLLEGQQELIRMLSSRLGRVDARFDSLLKWGIGLLVVALVGFSA